MDFQLSEQGYLVGRTYHIECRPYPSSVNFTVPLIMGYMLFNSNERNSGSITDSILDTCLSDIKPYNAENKLKKKVQKLFPWLRKGSQRREDDVKKLIYVSQVKEKMLKAFKRSHKAVKKLLCPTHTSKQHLRRCSVYYSHRKYRFKFLDYIPQLFKNNMMLECHLNMNFDTINEIHVTMSELYRYSDRFTALLSLPNPKDRNREVILAHIDNFYDYFIEMFEDALENEHMTLEENARIELNNFFDDCWKNQLEFKELGSKSKNSDTIDSIVSANGFCATDNVLNLTYAYFTFQTILFNKKTTLFENGYYHMNVERRFDICYYNLNYKSSLRNQGSKDFQKLKLNYDDFKYGSQIFEEHFRYYNYICQYFLADNSSDANIYAERIVDELFEIQMHKHFIYLVNPDVSHFLSNKARLKHYYSK